MLSLCSQVVVADARMLPESRIIGYYGNFYSTRMGILGEFPVDEMLEKFRVQLSKWRAADSKTKIVPAIEYIAVVAQASPGRDGKYRARMPDSQIQKAIEVAKQVDGIVILDIQTGLSNVQAEIAHLAPYLALPNVMLALDPEFSMPPDTRPGTRIGSMDAQEINYAINYLAEIVRKNNLPPKVLIVHRFTQRMLTNHKQIKLQPEVQVVIDMDGWGSQSKKLSSYHDFVASEIVEYTGIKLFYKNDLKEPGPGLFTPEQILKLNPVPVYVIYQ